MRRCPVVQGLGKEGSTEKETLIAEITIVRTEPASDQGREPPVHRELKGIELCQKWGGDRRAVTGSGGVFLPMVRNLDFIRVTWEVIRRC